VLRFHSMAMPRFLCLLILLLSILLSSRSSLADGQPAKTLPGWELIQAHVGQKLLRVQTTAKGIRIDAVRSTWSIISQAPKWDAVIFSRADKTTVTDRKLMTSANLLVPRKNEM
jgi:hypothetical protein